MPSNTCYNPKLQNWSYSLTLFLGVLLYVWPLGASLLSVDIGTDCSSATSASLSSKTQKIIYIYYRVTYIYQSIIMGLKLPSTILSNQCHLNRSSIWPVLSWSVFSGDSLSIFFLIPLVVGSKQRKVRVRWVNFGLNLSFQEWIFVM